jgi:hypothetical protein
VPPAVWGDWIKVKNRKHPAAMERVMEILKPRQAKGRPPPAGALSWSVDDRRDRLSRHRQPKVLRTHSAIRAASAAANNVIIVVPRMLMRNPRGAAPPKPRARPRRGSR